MINSYFLCVKLKIPLWECKYFKCVPVSLVWVNNQKKLKLQKIADISWLRKLKSGPFIILSLIPCQKMQYHRANMILKYFLLLTLAHHSSIHNAHKHAPIYSFHFIYTKNKKCYITYCSIFVKTSSKTYFRQFS